MEEIQPCRDEFRPVLVRTEFWGGETASHPQEGDAGAHGSGDSPYPESPAQANFAKKGVQDKGEDESSNACTREDDATCKPAAFREPLREQLHDGHVEKSAANPDTDTLKENKLPYLNGDVSTRYWVYRNKSVLPVSRSSRKIGTRNI